MIPIHLKGKFSVNEDIRIFQGSIPGESIFVNFGDKKSLDSDKFVFISKGMPSTTRISKLNFSLYSRELE